MSFMFTFLKNKYATIIISLLIEHDLLKDHFDEVAKELLKNNEYLDAIQLVQDMVIINTYSLKGNELSIGYDLRTDNEHIREIMLSSSLNSLRFEGPFTLKQGGVGFVGRYPIIQNDSLWGYSAWRLDYPSEVAQSSLFI